jgi:hypothetical protein
VFQRRSFLKTSLAGLFVFSLSDRAFGGSYLNRASVLLRGAELEARALRARFHDKELARVIHEVALARTRTAQEMTVPDEVKRAHPHLLLVLESYERAAEAAVRVNQKDFLVALSRARDEERIFVAILKQEGWTLPD